jgi:hypothetical protein
VLWCVVVRYGALSPVQWVGIPAHVMFCRVLDLRIRRRGWDLHWDTKLDRRGALAGKERSFGKSKQVGDEASRQEGKARVRLSETCLGG